jgi:CheY-like chemotaxis protein
MMPVMNGKELRTAMLGDSRLAQIPVVLITAGGAQAASSVPATEVLYKPLRIETVLSSVTRYCSA